MAEKESRPLRGYEGITTSDGYFFLPRAYFGLSRGGLGTGPVLLATFYLYIDGFEKTGRILCPDTRAAAELGVDPRRLRRWKRDLVEAGLIDTQRGSKYLEISALKDELKITAEIQRMTELSDLGGHLKKPRKHRTISTDVEVVDKSERRTETSDVVGQKRPTTSDENVIPGRSKTSAPIKVVKKTVLKDSVKQPTEEATARSGSKRASSPPKKKYKLSDPEGIKAFHKRLEGIVEKLNN